MGKISDLSWPLERARIMEISIGQEMNDQHAKTRTHR
jgi:hypothetical protein